MESTRNWLVAALALMASVVMSISATALAATETRLIEQAADMTLVQTEEVLFAHEIGGCDLDADGVDEIVTTNEEGYGVSIFSYAPGTYDATYALLSFPGEQAPDGAPGVMHNSPTRFGCGDINHDGFNDLITVEEWSNSDYEWPIQSASLHIYLGPLVFDGRSVVYEENDARISLPPITDDPLDYNGIRLEVGDVSGDGFDDLVVGTPNSGNADTAERGMAVLLYFGRDEWPAVVNTLNSTILSRPQYANAGEHIELVDMNGDGILDIAVKSGSIHGGEPVPAAVDVFISPPTFDELADFADLKVEEHNVDYHDVYFAGSDVNGDGYEDLIVGNRMENSGPIRGWTRGAAHVVYGGPDQYLIDTTVELSSQTQFALAARAGANFGGSVSSAGDVNGDGYGDVLIGATGAAPSDVGTVGLYLGATSKPVLRTRFVGSYLAEWSNLGGGLGTGDVNGDGLSDLLIANPGAERAHVILGATTN